MPPKRYTSSQIARLSFCNLIVALDELEVPYDLANDLDLELRGRLARKITVASGAAPTNRFSDLLSDKSFIGSSRIAFFPSLVLAQVGSCLDMTFGDTVWTSLEPRYRPR